MRILKEWDNSFEGFFEVKSVDGQVVTLLDLFKEQEYVSISTSLDPEVLGAFKPGYVIATRLLSLQGVYLLSGHERVLPFRSKERVCDFAKRVVARDPKYVLGDEDSLARAWEVQEKYREGFISYFGQDLILVPGEELTATMNGFLQHMKDIVLTKLSRKRGLNLEIMVWTLPILIR